MRLIDADALKSELMFDLATMMRMQEMHKKDMAVRVLNRIDEAPTIEAEPVRHGRLIRMDDSYAKWKCSECGAIEDHSGWPYCHCGAKMDAKEENT